LSLTSLAYLSKAKEVAILLSFPVVYSLIFSLTSGPITGVDQHRFFLASYFFLIILSAIALTCIFLFLFRHLRTKGSVETVKLELIGKKILVINKNTFKRMLIFLILASVLFPFLWPLYNSELYVIRTTDVSSSLNYQPAINWILQYTANASVLMTRKPAEFAWFTNRISKMPWPPDLTIYELRESITSIKANYLIVDELFLDTYTDSEVRNLYSDPWSQVNFIPVFQSSSEPHVIIYNVTSVWSDIPKLQVEAGGITLSKDIDAEYLNPGEATYSFELSGYSSYTLEGIPNYFFFEGIYPTPDFISIFDNEILFEGTSPTSYKVRFIADPLLEIGWKDVTFSEGWNLSSPEAAFKIDDKKLTLNSTNALTTIGWDIAQRKISPPINVTTFPFISFRYRFLNWNSDDMSQVYFTVRLYDESGVLEETPLIHPSDAGVWKIAHIPLKKLTNITDIALVVRMSPRTSLHIQVDYVAIAAKNRVYP
ncbi:MAG: hypothetical protein ACFFCD_17845, partial [Promethearchaeota archaeon]